MKGHNIEKLSLLFFFILLILLPLILMSNTEEKVLFSKAEESINATPSATLYPTAPLATVQPSPTIPLVPTTPPVSPTAVVSPTTGPQPTSLPTVSPTPPTTQPTVAPTFFPTILPTVAIPTATPSVPTLFPSPTTVPIQTQKIITLTDTVAAVVNDLFGVYMKPSETASITTVASTSTVETVLRPTITKEHRRFTFIEKDLAPNIFMQWFDRVFKRERKRQVEYRLIINPQGFVFIEDISLTMTASYAIFDEPIDRPQTITHVVVGEKKYFDRFGFIDNLNAARGEYASYPDNHNRVHAVTVVGASGNETNKDTPLTLDQWEALGFTDAVRLRTETSFDAGRAYAMNELYDAVNSLVPVSRDQLIQLLVRDDQISVRVE